MTELLFREDAYLRSCDATVVAVHGDAVELDHTVFYPLGGGQPGDTGTIGPWRVLDTRKAEAADSVLHMLEPGATPAPGMKLAAAIDWERRHRHMRLHTALHLLGAVVRAPVTGGRIAKDKAHLDFDVEMEALSKEQIAAAQRGGRAPARDPRSRPAGLRRHPRAQYLRDRPACGGPYPL